MLVGVVMVGLTLTTARAPTGSVTEDFDLIVLVLGSVLFCAGIVLESRQSLKELKESWPLLVLQVVLGLAIGSVRWHLREIRHWEPFSSPTPRPVEPRPVDPQKERALVQESAKNAERYLEEARKLDGDIGWDAKLDTAERLARECQGYAQSLREHSPPDGGTDAELARDLERRAREVFEGVAKERAKQKS
jgi:hypothetical protein